MAKNSIAEIAAAVARKYNFDRKESSDIVAAFFRIIAEGLRDDKIVKVRGLGTFKITPVKARESVNVNTGERVVIESHDKVTFVPDATMKNLVNKPFSQFTTVVVNEGVNFDSVDAAYEAEQQKLQSQEQEQQSQEQELQEEAAEEPAEETVEETKPQPEDTKLQDEETKLQAEETKPQAEDTKLQAEETKPQAEETKPQAEPTIVRHEVVEHKVVKHEIVENQIVKNTQTVDGTAADDAADNVSREYFDEQMDSFRRRLNHTIALAFFLLVVGLGVGFLLGHFVYNPNASKPIAQTTGTTDTAATKPQGAIASQPQQKPQADDSAKAVVAQRVDAAKKDTARKAAEPADSLSEMLKTVNADRRLRFGAYEVVGIEKTVRLKKGQTIEKYAKRVLGSEEMVVYFQALNGTNDMKPGDTVKVPKVRLKKKFRKT